MSHGLVAMCWRRSAVFFAGMALRAGGNPVFEFQGPIQALRGPPKEPESDKWKRDICAPTGRQSSPWRDAAWSFTSYMAQSMISPPVANLINLEPESLKCVEAEKSKEGKKGGIGGGVRWDSQNKKRQTLNTQWFLEQRCGWQIWDSPVLYLCTSIKFQFDIKK